MIGFFPVPYPDEILYSVFARYHSRSRNRYVSSTLNDLFGHDAARIVVDLPNKLGYLADQLPPGSKITAERLIDDHTLFPFYAPFLPPDRKNQLRTDMTERSIGGTIHGRLGILTSNISIEYLRFCPLCVENDIKSFGEPYWHRIHQVPGVFVCPHHSTFLENSSVECFYKNREKTLRSARNELNSQIPRFLEINNKNHLTHLFIAKEAEWLLNEKFFQNGGPDFFRKRFHQVLFRNNLANNNSVLIEKLHNPFKEFYSPDLLDSLCSSLDNKHTWLRRLLQASHHFQHPIRNLLLLNFLGYSIEEFIKISEIFYPFGEPPFPCLNPAADHFRELIINTVRIGRIRSRNDISGTFECECGFVYQRYGWDENGFRKFDYDQVNFYGEIFNKELLKFIQEGKNKDEVSLVFNIPKNIIDLQLKKIISKKSSLERKRQKSKFRQFDKLRKIYRKKWLYFQKLNPDYGRHKLSLLDCNIYHWLLKNDNEWFHNNSPVRQVVKEKANRVNWEERDNNLSKQVSEVADKILASPDYPIWISQTYLSKLLKIHHIVTKRPKCLPKTIETLGKNVETKEEFIARRIKYATDCFIKEKVRASYWKILERARLIRPHLINLPKVQEAIKDSLEKMNEFESNGWTS